MTDQLINLYQGDDPFLVNDAAKKWQKRQYGLERVILPEKQTLSALFQSASSPSLFTKSRMIIAKNPDFFTQTPSTKDLNSLKKIAAAINLNKHRLLIYTPGKALDKRKKISGILQKIAHIETFKAFKDWDQVKIHDWIRARCLEKNISISPDAVIALESSERNNLQSLDNLIEALITYIGQGKKITLGSVKALSKGSQISTFDLIDGIKKRKSSWLIYACKQLLSNGEDPIRLLATLTANYRLFLKLLILSQKGLHTPEIAKRLGKNPYYLNRILPDIKKTYSIPLMQLIFENLHHCDFLIKSGEETPKRAVLYSVIKIGQLKK